MASSPNSTAGRLQALATAPLRVGVIASSDVRRKATLAALSREGLDAAPTGGSVTALQGEDLDVVVLACEQFGADEVQEVQLLRERLPNAKIVVTAAEVGRRAIRDGLEAGLDGYVADADLPALALAVRSTFAGQLSLPREFREQVGKPKLSPREKQVLGMVVMGFSNAEIAKKLYVAETTVKSHLSSAFARLGVRSRGEATALILDTEAGFGAGILAISEPDGLRRPSAGTASQTTQRS
jgi:DNA-binding NarL/FixJ family response regulator